MESRVSTTIYLLRHGSTKHNEEMIFQGHSDVPENHLTEDGKSQVLKYFAPLSGVEFSAVFSSDLSRSRQTAEIIAGKLGLSVTPSHFLRGKKMGKYEGKSIIDFREKYKKSLSDFEHLSESLQWQHKVSDDVESNEEVINRVTNFLEKISVSHVGKNILVVTHGGAIRNFLFLLGWAKQYELLAGCVKNGAYIVVTHDMSGFKLTEVHKIDKR